MAASVLSRQFQVWDNGYTNWSSGPTKCSRSTNQYVEAEEAIYHDPADPLVNWDLPALEAQLRQGGYRDVRLQVTTQTEQRRLTAAHLDRWFGDEGAGTYGSRLPLDEAHTPANCHALSPAIAR